jgi:hypothetical protein
VKAGRVDLDRRSYLPSPAAGALIGASDRSSARSACSVPAAFSSLPP